MMSRTNNSFKNLIIALVSQFVGVVISFVARMYFIKILGEEYLGINGLFTNILTMLSLVELGIGPAIIYSLYKPLAEKDIPKIKALMKVYKQAYILIGVVVLFLGIALTPSLKYLIKDMPNIKNINIIYWLFVLNSSISYFYSYKRSLIIADQKRYIATIYRYGFYYLLNILQVVFLMITKNYLLFLILQIIFTLVENIAISKRADKIYPFLKEKNIEKLEKETINQIIKNTSAMVLHKIGSIVVNSTDNLLISSIIGVIWVGIYSNYQLITNAVKMIISQIFNSIISSIGNLGVTESKEKTIFIFNIVNLIGFWVYGFSSICLLILLNPFIEIWLGEGLLLPVNVVFILVISFFITGMRQAVTTFRDAYGLYWNDRYKPIFEVIINIIFSLLLGYKLGIIGIFLGTIISTITVCLWVEPYIVYKYAFKSSSREYFKKYFYYLIIEAITFIITYVLCLGFEPPTIFNLIIKIIICLIVPNIIFFIFFSRTKEFAYIYERVIDILKKMKVLRISEKT